MDPSVKILITVCDPTRRLISDFTMKNQNVKNDKVNLTEWFDDIVLEKDGGVKEDYPIVRVGMYAAQVQRWLQYFPR